MSTLDFLDEVPKLHRLTTAEVANQLHIDPMQRIKRQAIDYVFVDIQYAFSSASKSMAETNHETIEFMVSGLEFRYNLLETYYFSEFPKHDPLRRDALDIAMICDATLEIMDRADERGMMPRNSGFHPDIVELAHLFYTESQDLQKGEITADICQKESIFLAHIDAIDQLAIIEKNMKYYSPRELSILRTDHLNPMRLFVRESSSIGKRLNEFIQSTDSLIIDHMPKAEVIPLRRNP